MAAWCFKPVLFPPRALLVLASLTCPSRASNTIHVPITSTAGLGLVPLGLFRVQAPRPPPAPYPFSPPFHTADSTSLKNQRGSTPATKDGRKSHSTVCEAEILSWIQSIVVVTSPMGDQAPPAFAAITARPPQSWRYSYNQDPTTRSGDFHTTLHAGPPNMNKE